MEMLEEFGPGKAVTRTLSRMRKKEFFSFCSVGFAVLLRTPVVENGGNM